jgi:hypothetical protein
MKRYKISASRFVTLGNVAFYFMFLFPGRNQNQQQQQQQFLNKFVGVS